MRNVVAAMALMAAGMIAAQAEGATGTDADGMTCVSQDLAHTTADGRRFFYELRMDSQGATVLYLSDPEFSGQKKTTVATVDNAHLEFFSAKRVFRLSGTDASSTPIFAINGVDLDGAVIDHADLYIWTFVAASWTLKGQTLGPISCTYAHHYAGAQR